jgi:predicted PurR-regulated permease PerM
MNMTGTGQPNPTRHEIAAWLLSAAALLLVMRLRLLPAFLAGFLVYTLVHALEPLLHVPRLGAGRARLVVVGLIAVALAAVLALLGWAGVLFSRNEPESVPALLKKMAEIVDGLRGTLPAWIVDVLPGDVDGLRHDVVRWLHGHAGELQTVGREAVRVAAQVLAGMVIGALVSLRDAAPAHESRPLAAALLGRAARLAEAFRSVVFAQARIAALNTLFAALYLGVALPALGVRLPLVKTMVGITFVAGLLPVVGNLFSNAVVAVVSLSHSPAVAFGSLAYLVVVHKLEYFLNARIVGARIRAQVWELLLAMLLMEAAFGAAGLVAAPICYAFLKGELAERGLV